MAVLNTHPPMQTEVAAVLNSPVKFSLWWQKRAYSHDRAIVAEAMRRGLITRGSGLLFLTTAGKALRAAGEIL
jgi:hypothetical protein